MPFVLVRGLAVYVVGQYACRWHFLAAFAAAFSRVPRKMKLQPSGTVFVVTL